jgi:AcrR family transcriptional regulator
MRLFTRFRILNATRALVAEVGVGRVTMRAIARLANITAPAIYKHFKNKQALLDEVTSSAFVELAQDMLNRAREAKGRSRIEKMAQAAETWATDHARLFEMMAAPRSNDEMPIRRLELELRQERDREHLPWHEPRQVALILWSQMRGFLGRQPGETFAHSTRWMLQPFEQQQRRAA